MVIIQYHNTSERIFSDVTMKVAVRLRWYRDESTYIYSPPQSDSIPRKVGTPGLNYDD
jgi:hypothetical protein